MFDFDREDLLLLGACALWVIAGTLMGLFWGYVVPSIIHHFNL